MDEDKGIFVFVLMPFDKKFDDFYKFGIKEPAATLNILTERVDEQIYSEGILERIYRQIELADIVIADMSGQNPNVFYEVGYAHAKGKLCILVTSSTEDIPFDLKHRRHVVYGDSIQTLKALLVEELKWAAKEITNIKNSQIQVRMSDIDGDLKKTEWYAEGIASFTIDLVNSSETPSAEIDAIYFYCTTGWKLNQDGKECSSTGSDMPGFQRRHFLNPPVRRLQKNSWAQLQFTSQKVLAYATSGAKLQDRYKTTGRSLLRLVTDKGNMDYELRVDVTFDEFPF